MIEQIQEQCWQLDTHLACYILPRLLYLKNWHKWYSIPSTCEDIEEWQEILDEIVWTFTYISKGYPSAKDHIIKDVAFSKGSRTEDGVLITRTINFIFKEGKGEDDYLEARKQDIINMERCKQGLKLFAENFMSLWI